MMRRLAYKIICVLLTLISGITVTHVKRQLSANTSSVAADTDGAAEESSPTPPTVDLERPADFFLAENPWTHDGYTIERRSRKAPRDDGEGPTASPTWLDVYYVVVKKAGKVISQFDADVYSGIGNSADFAPFPFLGGETPQVFISQDTSRGGRQWIVSSSPRFRVIFDGYKYSVGREGYDLCAIDLDKDGIYEITVPLTSFYGFANLSPAGTPLPTIVFKYNVRRERYLPANLLFRAYLLRDVDKHKAAIKPAEDQMGHLSDIMSITLDHIFAGEERKAWIFFEQSYKLSDKKEMKAAIKAQIKDHPVYRFIYKRASDR